MCYNIAFRDKRTIGLLFSSLLKYHLALPLPLSSPALAPTPTLLSNLLTFACCVAVFFFVGLDLLVALGLSCLLAWE